MYKITFYLIFFFLIFKSILFEIDKNTILLNFIKLFKFIKIYIVI